MTEGWVGGMIAVARSLYRGAGMCSFIRNGSAWDDTQNRDCRSPPPPFFFIIKLHQMTLYDGNYTAECQRCCHFYCQLSVLGRFFLMCASTHATKLVKLDCWTDMRWHINVNLKKQQVLDSYGNTRLLKLSSSSLMTLNYAENQSLIHRTHLQTGPSKTIKHVLPLAIEPVWSTFARISVQSDILTLCLWCSAFKVELGIFLAPINCY